MADSNATDKEESEDSFALLGFVGGMASTEPKIEVRPRPLLDGGEATPGVTLKIMVGDGNPAGFTLTLIGADAYEFLAELDTALYEAIQESAGVDLAEAAGEE